jgi:hypothetical protein
MRGRQSHQQSLPRQVCPSPHDPRLEDEVYQKVWNCGPYTSFHMVRYLITISRRAKGLRSFLKTPTILIDIPADRIMEDWNNGHLQHLYNGQTGLCTSFAIKVVQELKLKHKGGYDFSFYDLGEHRLALCNKTNVVIDSSLRGAGTLVHSDRKTWVIRGRCGSGGSICVKRYEVSNRVCNMESETVLTSCDVSKFSPSS